MHCALYTLSDIPREEGWLLCQPHPVVAVGEGDCLAADVVVADEASARPLLEAIDRQPDASLVLVQLLRAIDHLPITAALTAESIAYGLLQAGESHRRWLEQRDEAPTIVIGESGPPIVLEREGPVLHAELNRPEYRNAISVEMRDALVEMFELVALDDSIERLELSARGGCFSVGGELREFGLSESVTEAHCVRSLRHPGRELAVIAGRVHCHLHSACIGSGIEIPAFAGRVTASPKTFFQLPELEMGLIPGAGGCVSIARRIGRQRTALMVLNGKRVGTQTALDWGLIDAIEDQPLR